MVVAEKIGSKRSFGVGLFLTIVTFGIYAVYWNYKAHNEVYRQFELAREGRDEGMVWYVLGLVVPPFLLAYLWVFTSNIAYLRDRIGLRRSMTPGRLVAILGTGVGAVILAFIIFAAALTAEGLANGGDPTATDATLQGVSDAASAAFLVLALLAVVLLAYGYHGLQRDVNELWDAYDARAAYLRSHPEEASPARRLRSALVSLRTRRPDLRALPRLDRLVLLADAGDVDARLDGERLIVDVRELLNEYQRLEQARDTSGEVDAERMALLEQALFLPPEATSDAPPDALAVPPTGSADEPRAPE